MDQGAAKSREWSLALRFWTAGLLAPTGALLITYPAFVFLDVGATENWPDPAYIFFVALAGSVIVGIPATLTLGSAVHALLYKLKWRSVFHYLAAGTLSGALVGGVFGALTGPDPSKYALSFLLLGAATGALTAIFGWFIRRPDRYPA